MASTIILAVAVAVAAWAYYTIFYRPSVPSIPKGKYAPVDALNQKSKKHYDVAIVGGGPSGSTCGYYMSKAGAKVAVLEKETFPRDKFCGDAVCKTAIEILFDMQTVVDGKRMSVFEQLKIQNKSHVADSGGLVSPGGISYIGRSHEELGAIPAAIAVKRIHLDEAIAMAGKHAGSDLKEGFNVQNATFNKQDGLWTVTAANGDAVTARVLVCADGAQSQLARKLGIVQGEPQGSCTRAFVKGGKHNFNADGVVFYDADMLPGYAALFRHPNDELNYCAYLIPGNPKVTNDDLKHWHFKLLRENPFMRQALGPDFDDEDEDQIEPMRAGPLRLGGVPVSYSDHCLVTGDAAGFIDPLTGEGIHHAMDSGRITARVLLQAINAGNYSAEHMGCAYHQTWLNEFGYDFTWSMNICQFLYRYPILIDAATAAVARKGNKFLARWADIMTGRVPKVHLLHPVFVVVIGFELIKLLTVGWKGKNIYKDYVKQQQQSQSVKA